MLKEAIEKRVSKVIGVKRHPDICKKISNSHKGKIMTEQHKINLRLSCKHSVLVLNLENGIFYSTIKDAAIAHNHSISYLEQKLRGDKTNKTSLIRI